ncbi:MAG: DUF4236 domain-containing protein, partial [Planctomycetia bacterium]|nr:DUF4236 domain-containing protein [Planctomycetia bacterium]
MGFIRKSVRVRPFRFNLSKSGLGVSAGVTGARIGTGSHGTYVHLGRGGLYYRKTLAPPSRRSGTGRRSEVTDRRDGTNSGQGYGPSSEVSSRGAMVPEASGDIA